ncbi:MAG: hypothetical protein Q9184_006857 [Pyrenodesmia sp. 2 TL-2023]
MLSSTLLCAVSLFVSGVLATIEKRKLKNLSLQQDKEPLGQKSICHSNCGFPGDNAGTDDMLPGVYAAAVGPDLGGNSDDCTPCGSCYSIKNSGNSYCLVGDEGCPYVLSPFHPSLLECFDQWLTFHLGRIRVAPGPDAQGGDTDEIKVMVVNHCMDCSKVPHHFDINAAPVGWDNPQIWWKRVDMSECRGGAAGGGGYSKLGESGNATIAEGVSMVAGADAGSGGNVGTLSKSAKGVVGGGRKLLENGATHDPANQDNPAQDNGETGTVENSPSPSSPPSSSPPPSSTPSPSSSPTSSTPTTSTSPISPTSSTPTPSPSTPAPKRRCKRFKA